MSHNSELRTGNSELDLMLRFLVHRPIAVFLTFFGMSILGIILMQTLPISLLPNIPIPQITVQVNYPNTATRTFENTITKPLRNQLFQVGNLKDIKSESRDGSATIELAFEFGTSTNLTFIEVNEKIDQIMSNLPRDLERPKVIKANAGDIPVFYLSVIPNTAQENSIEFSQFAQSVLKRRIEQLPSVAFVDLSGYVKPEIVLIPKTDRLLSLGIHEEDLGRILQANNFDLGSVLVQDGHYQYNIQFESRLQSLEDLETIYFKHDDQILALTEIADIELRPQKQRGKYLFNDQNAIVFAVRKKANAQLFELKNSFSVLLKNLETEYPDFSFRISNDQSELLEISVQNLQTSLLYGGLFAFLVLFLFFKEWQAPILMGVAIPIALILTLFGFFLLEISINIISLSGLILGVGLMIDNSIIVIENIRQYRQKGFSKPDAAVKGTNEVIRPLMSSALTTCSVFVPLIFLSGMAGALFFDQAISIVLALISSLLVAYFLLPTVLNLGKKISVDGQVGTDTKHAHSFVELAFIQSVDFVLKYRLLFTFLFILILIASGFVFQKLSQEAFPKITRAGLEIKIDWNEPIQQNESERRMLEAWKHFEKDFAHSNIFIGEQQFLLNENQFNLNEIQTFFFGQINQNDTLQTQQLKHYFSQKYPLAKIQITSIKNLFDEIFGNNEPRYLIHLQSNTNLGTPSLEDLKPILNWLEEEGIKAELPLQKEDLTIEILREQALIYELDYQTILTKLQSLFNANEIGVLKTNDAQIPIKISYSNADFDQKFKGIFIQNKKGESLPLSQFVRLKKEKNHKKIIARKSGESIEIPLKIHSENQLEELKKVASSTSELTAFFSGQAFENQRLVRELMEVFGISLLLLYLILAAQFESLSQPIIVLLTVPIGLSGALFLLYLTGQTLNLVSIIGMVVMSGIVVNDAILKVDIMNRSVHLRDKNAIIHEAGIRRFRPILMTSLTTIFALCPILFSAGLGAELQLPLAISVIGGLTFGTISSLYFIPILYKFFGAL